MTKKSDPLKKHQKHERFLESLDRVNLAMQRAGDLDEMMSLVLDEVLAIFDCDRSSLIYPCDPKSPTWTVPMECTRPEYPGIFALGVDMPSEPEAIAFCQLVLDNDGPVQFGSESEHPLPAQLAERFNIQSQIAMSIHPKRDKPWIFCLSQCSGPRVWNDEEARLFQEIGRRLADALTVLSAQRHLQESERKYRRFVETSRDGVWALDENCLTSFANARMAEMLGYSANELIGHPLSDFMFEEDVADHEKHMQLRRKGVSEQYNRRFRCKDGSELWTLVSASVIKGENGEFQGSFAMLNNITERKRDEQRMALLERALNQSSDAVYLMDEETTRFNYVNDAACRVLGYSREELLSMSPPDIDPDIPDEKNKALTKEVVEGHPLFFETRHRAKDGRIFPVEIHASAFEYNGEKFSLAVARDITERKLTEVKLTESEQKFRSLAENMPDNIVRYDRQGLATYVNPSLERMLGTKPEEILGKSVRERHPDPGYEVYAQALDDAIASGEDSEIEFVVPGLGTAAEPVIHQVRFIVERDEQGEVAGVLAIGHDISEQKKTDRELSEKQRLLLEAQKIAHVGNWHHDLVTGELYWSEEFFNILGIPPQKPTMELGFSLIHPDDKKLLLGDMELSATKYGEFEQEFRIVRPDGDIRWIHNRWVRIDNEKGEEIKRVGTHQDITERKRVEEVVHRSEEALKEAQRIAHLGSWQLNLETNEVVWSEELYRMCGYDPALPPPDYDVSSQLYTPDSWERLGSAMTQTVEKGTPYEIELEMVQAEGDNKWIWARGELVRDADDKPVMVRGVALDITERKLAEQQLSLLNFALNNSRDEAFLIGEQAEIIYANDEACRVLKYSREELLTMVILDIDSQYSMEQWPELWVNIKKSGSVTFESVHRVRDGSEYPVEISATHLNYEGRDYILALSHDISERKHDQEVLQQNEEALKEAQRIANMGSWHMDLATYEVRWSEELYRIYGFELTQPVPNFEETAKLFKEESWARLNAEITHTLETGTPYEIEMEMVATEGKERWVHARGELVRDAEGKPVELRGVLMDITERKLAEQALNEKQEQLLEAQRIAKLGSWELNLVTDELVWSDEIYEIFEIDKKAFGASYEAFLNAIHPDDRGMVNAAYTDSVSGHHDYEVNHRLLMADGRIKYVREQGHSYYDSEGRPLRSVGTVQDMTHLHEVEAQLRQAQKMEAVGTLVGGIAHDFNNKLAAIIANLYLAKREVDAASKVAERLRNVEALSQDAATMVHDLLVFARKGTVDYQPLSLTHFIKEATKLNRVVIPEDIKLTINSCKNPLTVVGDATQLQQAFLNLLTNARDALEHVEHARIDVALDEYQPDADFLKRHPEAAQLESFASIRVSDNGHGIDRESREHVFEPFYTTKEVGKGTGLGLAMVYGVVQSHHGFVEVESDPGKGSSFTIYLPLSQDGNPSIQAGDADEMEAGHGETILIADDDDNVRETFSDVLTTLGYRVLAASNGRKAVDLFQQHATDIDLVILDVVMPELRGPQVAQLIWEINPQVKVMYATGYEDREHLVSEGEEMPILRKPYTFQQVSKIIRQQLGH